ncbi:ecto-ADP-ribosyltransferase 5-like, partial [Sinocyclocheilus rhinocerous]|uniref:ecto-ADP-ribosyltransferase 5-like n=1 Tax=Sinocyclocheilus rhinocerous TaxID=307959 RepID=UPI0007B9E301
MLLMIEALLLISATLQDHRAAAADGQIFPLDMALDSVDDLYVGCKKIMACLVESVLLENELYNSPEFRTVWQVAVDNYEPPEDELKVIHSVAIYVYTNSRYNLYQDFNHAVRSDKQKYKDKSYTWYSLQFLLTEAIQILKETQNGCKSTYRGTNIEFNKNVLNKQVRFGSFTSSSLSSTVAGHFETKSCFEITTCEGADLTKYSTFPNETEVLIPPYEVFKVKEIKTRSVQKDLWCETVFVLESIGVRSDLNCDLFKRPTKSITNRSRFR